MADFLTTSGTTYSIEQLILNADKELTLVTPYLKISKIFKDRISDACKQNIRITLVYGKSELQDKEKQILFNFDNVRVYYCHNLHAKCYYNESSLIITSMNLHEFSANHNREMGILISKKEDTDIFTKAVNETQSIINASILQKDFTSPKSKRGVLQTEILVFDQKNYIEQWNFYLPSLKNYFKIICPQNDVELEEDRLKIKDFPKRDIDLEIKNRVDIKFKNEFDYGAFQTKYQSNIGKGMGDIRFYWNPNKISIYPEKDFLITPTEAGLQAVMEKFIFMIDKVIENSDLAEYSILEPIVSK